MLAKAFHFSNHRVQHFLDAERSNVGPGFKYSLQDVRADFEYRALRGILELPDSDRGELLQNMENCRGISGFEWVADFRGRAFEWVQEVVARSEGTDEAVYSDAVAEEHLKMSPDDRQSDAIEKIISYSTW